MISQAEKMGAAGKSSPAAAAAGAETAVLALQKNLTMCAESTKVTPENNCVIFWGLEGVFALMCILWFAAAYKGHQLYKSRHFDPDVQADLEMMDPTKSALPRSMGLPATGQLLQPVQPYQPPAVVQSTRPLGYR